MSTSRRKGSKAQAGPGPAEPAQSRLCLNPGTASIPNAWIFNKQVHSLVHFLSSWSQRAHPRDSKPRFFGDVSRYMFHVCALFLPDCLMSTSQGEGNKAQAEAQAARQSWDGDPCVRRCVCVLCFRAILWGGQEQTVHDSHVSQSSARGRS